MVDVFISYKRDERQRAERIARKLQALDLDVWFDARIPTGVSFDVEIEQALKIAKAVLVLWTPGSATSEWVRNEATAGKDSGRLVALMLIPCELPLAFRSIQYEPLYNTGFGDDDPSWMRTVERIKDLVGRRETIEAKQKAVLRFRKALRAFGWLIAWPVVSALILFSVGYFLAPLQPVRPGTFGFTAESWDSGFVFAMGSIDVDGDKLPPNHVEISCRRDTRECLEARAELRDGELSVFTDRRPITRWDENVIIARTSTPCANIVMTVDRTLHTVNTVRERREFEGSEALCSWMNERNSYRLIDGGARVEALENERQPYFLALFFSVLAAWTLFVVLKIVTVFRR